MKGPKRVVVVEKAREVGERWEKVRVSGDARRGDPFGRPASTSLVVILLPIPLKLPILLMLATGTCAMNSGISLLSVLASSCRDTSRVSSLCFDVSCCRSRGCLATGPLRCHGALSTAAILGHNSDIADEICWMLTGATVAVAAWKAIVGVFHSDPFTIQKRS